jgi:light-regulated signal transduction histidine kinase (bacteriophytochrome)
VLSHALYVRRLRQEKSALEQHLHQRTAELEAVNKELESFCYAVSHDLRAPLRTIAGFANALSEEYLDTLDVTGQDYVQRVIAGAKRMDHLIDDLLDLSRVTRAEFLEQIVDLSAISRIVGDELQRGAPERQVRVTIDDGIQVSGDARLLRIALENLLGNAWKFTANNPIAHIEVRCQTNSEGKLVCVVRDDGAGFDMTYANKLFGAFQRLHSATQFPGTGIGLATVQRIMHRHGGRIWAEAKVNEGATFYLTFPSLRHASSSA